MNASTFNAAWDDRPHAYDRLRSGHLNARRTAFLVDRLSARRGGRRVVEIGAGTGWLGLRLAAALPRISFTGVDPLAGYVTYANEQATARGMSERVRYVEGTAERLAEVLAPGARADVLLANDVLHHVGDMAAAARAAADVAAPGARWIVIEPNAVNPYVWLSHTLKHGEAIFRWRRFLRGAAAAGWRLERQSPLFLIPPQIATPPEWAKRVERRLEGVRPLAGGIALELRLG